MHDPDVDTTRLTTIPGSLATVECVTAVLDTVLLLVVSAARVPLLVVVLLFARDFVAIDLMVRFAEPVWHNVALPAALDECRPIATVERQTAVGDAIALAARLVTVLPLIEVILRTVHSTIAFWYRL